MLTFIARNTDCHKCNVFRWAQSFLSQLAAAAMLEHLIASAAYVLADMCAAAVDLHVCFAEKQRISAATLLNYDWCITRSFCQEREAAATQRHIAAHRLY